MANKEKSIEKKPLKIPMYCRRMKTSALFRLLMKLLQLSHLWPLRK